MGQLKLTNNASSTLVGTLAAATANSINITVQGADKDEFPVVTTASGDWFPVTLVDALGVPEIMRCTTASPAARCSPSPAAQEGTTKRDFLSARPRSSSADRRRAVGNAGRRQQADHRHHRQRRAARRLQDIPAPVVADANLMTAAGRYPTNNASLNLPIAEAGYLWVDIFDANNQYQEWQDLRYHRPLGPAQGRRRLAGDHAASPQGWYKTLFATPQYPAGAITDFAGARNQRPGRLAALLRPGGAAHHLSRARRGDLCRQRQQRHLDGASSAFTARRQTRPARATSTVPTSCCPTCAAASPPARTIWAARRPTGWRATAASTATYSAPPAARRSTTLTVAEMPLHNHTGARRRRTLRHTHTHNVDVRRSDWSSDGSVVTRPALTTTGPDHRQRWRPHAHTDHQQRGQRQLSQQRPADDHPQQDHQDMTAIRIIGFTGEQPRIIPRLIPDSGAQSAFDVRLDDGGLMPTRRSVKAGDATAGWQTIYKWLGNWIGWAVTNRRRARPGRRQPPLHHRRRQAEDARRAARGGVDHHLRSRRAAGDEHARRQRPARGGQRRSGQPATSSRGSTASPGSPASARKASRAPRRTTAFRSTGSPTRPSRCPASRPRRPAATSRTQRIYRSQSGPSGTLYYLIAERSASAADFVDNIGVEKISEPCRRSATIRRPTSSRA